MSATWRMRSLDGEPKWGHPNGWTIKRMTRDWSLRGFERGTVGIDSQSSPKHSYEVRVQGRPTKGPAWTFSRLRDARAWCDANRWSLTERRDVPVGGVTTATGGRQE